MFKLVNRLKVNDYLEKSTSPAFRIVTVLIFVILLISFTGDALSQDSRVSINNIDSLINSSNWQDRDLAASAILTIPQLDSTRKVNLIINGIRKELAGPSNYNYPIGSYFSYSDGIISQYLLDLTNLGQWSLPILQNNSQHASGNLKECLIIAMGLNKDESVHPMLPALIDTSSLLVLRTKAVSALGRYKNKNDSIYFKRALEDTCKVIVHNDNDFPGKGFHETYYPVRGEAIAALKGLGYEVAPDTLNGCYSVKEK